MLGRLLKIFLPLLISVISLLFFAGNSTVSANGEYGSITVCKIIADPDGNVFNGSTVPGVTFTIPGITPAQTSEAPATGQIPDSNFTTPLALSADILGSDEQNDSQCVTYGELPIGSYYYGQESINPAGNWKAPLYNDQFTVQVFNLGDFFTYDSNLFDGNSANDDSRNKNADGHIILTQERPDRTLVVLNQLQSGPSVGGGGPNIGGNIGTPQCPTDRPQQVDQVWFSDIKPGEVTVHWANKGDAWGFQIAYGPSQDNLIWGVEVADPNATQYTLKDLPGGDLWVSVTAKSSKECGGPSSPVVKVSGAAPQVLGAAGVANSTALFLAGFGLITLGLWQTQLALAKRVAKRA